jgi:putative PEP-CTERM system TPR-repeat lipoprotein
VKKLVICLVLLLAITACVGKSKEELYAKGVDEIKKGNPNGAIVFLKNALEKDQNYLDARQQLAIAYMNTGKLEQSEREFRKVLNQNPGNADIKLLLAKVFNMSQKPQDALKMIDEYLAQKPGDAEGLECKGTAFAVNRQPNEAERYLLQALQVGPKRLSSKLELALVYASSGRANDARRQVDEVLAIDANNVKAFSLLAQLEMSQGNRNKALELYRKLADISKNDPAPLYKMGIVYSDLGDMAKAEQISTELSQKFPKRGESARLAGILNFNKKKYNEASAALQNSIKIQPTTDGYYYLGLTNYANGQLEGAISQFRTILDRVPTHHRSRIMIAMILLQQKRLDDAVTEVKKVLDADPQNALAHNVLGSAYLAKGQFEDGMRELNKATEIDPKLIDAHIKKGVINLSKGKEREGEAELQAAINVNPEVLNSRMILYSYYMRQGNQVKAVSLLNKGLTGKPSDAPLYNALASTALSQRKPDDALKYLQKAKAADPSFFPVYFNIANYYAAKGEHDKSIAEYNAILAKDPTNLRALLAIAATQELKGRETEALNYYLKAKDTKNTTAFIALAGYYARKKDIGKAFSVVDEALKADPKNVSALEAKGKLLMSEKKYNEAIKVFDDIEQVRQGAGIGFKINAYMAMKAVPKAIDQAQRVITLKPNSALGFMVLASIYESQNDTARAIDELKKGLKAEPANLSAKLQLGNLYLKMKDFIAAGTTINEIIRTNDDFAPAHYALGSLYEQTGKKKDAVKKYRDALAKSQSYVPALNNLAYLAADGYGSKEESLQLAINAFKLEPGNPGVMDTLGYALLKNGKYGEAVKVLDKATAALPNNPTVLYHFALALKGSGDQKKSLDRVQKALQLGNFPEIAQARQLHSELSSGGGKKAK